MKLEKVVIKNFLSFKDTEFVFHGKQYLNVLIGLNDTGKTNFLKALNISSILEDKAGKFKKGRDFKFNPGIEETEIVLCFQLPSETVKETLRILKGLAARVDLPALNSFLTATKSEKSLNLVLKLYDQKQDDNFYDWKLKYSFQIGSKKLDIFSEIYQQIVSIFEKKQPYLKSKEHFQPFQSKLKKLFHLKWWKQPGVQMDVPEWWFIDGIIKKTLKGEDWKEGAVWRKWADWKWRADLIFLSFLFIQFQNFYKDWWNKTNIYFSRTFFSLKNQIKEKYSADEFRKNEILLAFLLKGKSKDDVLSIHSILKGKWKDIRPAESIKLKNILETGIFNQKQEKLIVEQISDESLSFAIEESSGIYEDLSRKSEGFWCLIGFEMISSFLTYGTKTEKKVADFDLEQFFSKNFVTGYSGEVEELKKIFFTGNVLSKYFSWLIDVSKSSDFTFSFKLCLLDEPETHLYPDRQREALKGAIQMSEEFLVNTFIVTHSPWFINQLQLKETIVVYKETCWQEQKKESKLVHLKYFPRTVDLSSQNSNYDPMKIVQTAMGVNFDFAYPVRALGKDKKIVFVEGESDYLIFDWFYKKFENSEEKKESEVVFIWTNANEKMPALRDMIVYANALNFPFVVLYDGDLSGKEKTEKLKVKYEKVKDRFQTLAEIWKDFTNLESLFTEDDRKSLGLKAVSGLKGGRVYSLNRLFALLEKSELQKKTLKNLTIVYDWIKNFFKEQEKKKYN